MASLSDKRTLERQRFFDGQQLLAADLDEVVDHHRWRRELHNRSLHQAGVASGFAVTGARGDREVTVGAGYALDAAGHEIISTRAVVEPVPPVAGDPGGGAAFYDLTVAYVDEEEGLEEAETRRGTCGDRGTVRRLEAPALCWVRLVQDATGALHPADPGLAAAVEAGFVLRLARVGVLDCRLDSLTVAERRNARPPSRPYLACGHVQTPAWKVEIVPGGDDDEPPLVFFVVEVDTAAAGFRAAPCYSAGLRGPRQVTIVRDGTDLPHFADGVVSVENAAPASFRLRVLALILASPGLLREAGPDDYRIPWTLAWMGIEP